ncbi:MAG: glycosyltransferase [Candidatus Brocadiaceae bacterium]|nr:glycosyltransferase [Candidatus Brocadiaceae bacterium]
MSTCLIIFAKSPIPGKVKTRVTPHITPTDAAKLYEAFIADIVSNALKQQCERIIVAYTPLHSETSFRKICGQSIHYIPQEGYGLGERMKNAFRYAFNKGSKRVVIIGTDSPTLPLLYIRNAFSALEEVPITIGPTFDGGYYLIGLSEQNEDIFDGIEWSTSSVFSQTLARIKSLNKKVNLLSPWYDVDTPEDLEFLRSHIIAMKLSGASDVPVNTMQFLKI